MSAMHSGNMKAVMQHSISMGDLTASQKAAARKNYLRTRNEGSLYQKRGMEGSMKDLLSHINPASVKPKSALKKQEPRDFTQDNIKRIRQMSLDKQQAAEASAKKPLRAPWTDGSNGKDDQGKRTSDLNKTQVIRRQNVPYAPPSRSKSIRSGLNSKAIEDAPAFKEPIDPSVRRKSLAEAMTDGGKSAEKNYVELNKNSVASRKPERSASAAGVRSGTGSVVNLNDVPKAKVGVLPDYMAGRRQSENMAAEWAKEAKKHNLPPGSHLMPEAERVQLLTELEAAKKKKEREMFLLPLRSDTLRATRKREELETSLREIDQGLSVLAKPLVIVQDSTPHPISVNPSPAKPVVLPLERKHRPTWKEGDAGTAKPIAARPASSERRPSAKTSSRPPQNGIDKKKS